MCYLQWNSVFGPMFLFGRYGPDITQEDQDMAAAITKVYSQQCALYSQ